MQFVKERSPCHYHALSRFIELVWRQGNVELADAALKNATDHNGRANIDAGYNYCKGLLEWYESKHLKSYILYNI